MLFYTYGFDWFQINSVVGRDFGGSSKTEIETEKVSLLKTWTEADGEINTEITSISFKYIALCWNFPQLLSLTKIFLSGGKLENSFNY